MAIGIDPTVDFAFKRLLGSPEHPAITLHFLNAVFAGDPVITDVDILNRGWRGLLDQWDTGSPSRVAKVHGPKR